MKSNAKTLMVTVDRFDGDTHYQTTHEVPTRDNQTVLDVVTWIQQHDDPTLTYRFACRVGMCGSCAMNVNGEPKWSCRTHVSKVVSGDASLSIAPLRNMPVLRDLSVDMTEFFDKWTQAVGYFVPTKTKDDPLPEITPDDRARAKANQSIECINCGICYSACDVVAANDAYLGPAALNRAWTLMNDERDGARQTRLDSVSGDAGCHNCHSQHGCSTYCPNLLAPASSIAGLKRQTLMNLLPWGPSDD